MNAAVRATVRVGLYTGAKVYFVHEVQIAYKQLQYADMWNNANKLNKCNLIKCT